MLDLAIVMNARVPTLVMIDMEQEVVVMIHVQEMQTRYVAGAGTTRFMLQVYLLCYALLLKEALTSFGFCVKQQLIRFRVVSSIYLQNFKV